MVLAPSGTDCELYALALAGLAPGGRPVSNILLAPRKPAAACRWPPWAAISPTIPRWAIG
ncbi:hypothetical protein RAA17_03255 [Komagataeibacter rhaeticus]|nr:hypothetical protein [Komagataeibacter rhaeticus]